MTQRSVRPAAGDTAMRGAGLALPVSKQSPRYQAVDARQDARQTSRLPIRAPSPIYPDQATIIEAARWATQQNFAVIPCRPGGDVPALTEWQTATTFDADHAISQIHRIRECNLAVATGRRSRVLVLRAKSPDALASLELFDPLDTLWSVEPGGDQDVWFRMPSDCALISSGEIGAGLEVVAEGDCVLLPPSRTDLGECRWAVSPATTRLADLSARLLNRIAAAGLLNDHVEARSEEDPVNLADRLRKVREHILESPRNEYGRAFLEGGRQLGRMGEPPFHLSPYIAIEFLSLISDELGDEYWTSDAPLDPRIDGIRGLWEAHDEWGSPWPR